jgi:alkylation response protein AidB-like acyl-CoA dehydrogenase
MYQLGVEHEALRETVRALAEKEIAPYAAEVDELERYPREAQAALVRAGFHAVHIPEAYGGQGADSVATCIVIEEVARVCASSSLIPAVNKLGTMGLLLAGSKQLCKQVLPSLAAGSMVSYALSEREAGSDAAAMRTRAQRDGNHWVLNGTKCWISNAGQSTWYTVMAVTDPAKGAGGISAFVVHKGDPGFSVGPKERKLGIRGSPTREIYFEDCTIPADRIIGEPGTGFKTALQTLDHTRPTIGAQAVGIAQGAVDASIDYVKQRKQFNKPIADFRGYPIHAGRHGDEDRGGPTTRLRRRDARRARCGKARVYLLSVEMLRLRRGNGGDDRRGATVRRLRLHPRLPSRADDARREDHPDIRGNQPDPAPGDGPRPAQRLDHRSWRRCGGVWLP